MANEIISKCHRFFLKIAAVLVYNFVKNCPRILYIFCFWKLVYISRYFFSTFFSNCFKIPTIFKTIYAKWQDNLSPIHFNCIRVWGGWWQTGKQRKMAAHKIKFCFKIKFFFFIQTGDPRALDLGARVPCINPALDSIQYPLAINRSWIRIWYIEYQRNIRGEKLGGRNRSPLKYTIYRVTQK